MFEKRTLHRRLLYKLAAEHSQSPTYVLFTVGGFSPLTLEEAASKEINSLVQYGKIIQNGTPTPNAPVDIVCNNGTLKMVDDELPSGYKRLIGIDFDGKFWYETGEALTGEDDVTMTLDNTSASGQNVFGSYNGTGSGRKNFSLYIYGSTASTSSYFRYGDQLKRPVLGNGRRTITFGKSGTSGFSTDISVESDEFSTPSNTYIGMLPNSTSPEYTGDIIGSILVGTRLEWIPCENPGGVIGYYEKYNGNFIAPTGSGTPVSLGYDNSHRTVLSVEGTPEVLNVGGKNLLKMPTYDEVTNSSQVINYWNIPIKLAPNTTYYMSSHYLNDYTSKGKTIYVLVTANAAANTDYATIAHKSVGIRDRELTTDNSGYLYFRVNGGVTRELYEEMLASTEAQLELGSAATSYEPYHEPQIASVHNLFAVGNYADTQDIISGAVNRKIGVKVFDGTEAFTISGAAFRTVELSDKAANTKVFCSHFNGDVTPTMAVSTMPDLSVKGYGPNEAIFFKYSDITTVADFKAFLAAQYAAGVPVIVLYPLAEETTEAVAPQSLNTIDGDNILSMESAVGNADFTVKYYKKIS